MIFLYLIQAQPFASQKLNNVWSMTEMLKFLLKKPLWVTSLKRQYWLIVVTLH